MSILTRFTERHLDDGALAELWTAAATDGADTARHPHLDACADCRVRLTSFSTWMDSLKAEAIEEADEAFPAERLKAQLGHIMRRLEAAEYPTRIIAFPKAHVSARRSSSVHRWITASAAAGLITGVALGQLMDLRHFAERPVERIETVRTSSPGIVPASATLSEDAAALTELDEIATPRYEALQAYDTFTPRAADFIQPR